MKKIHILLITGLALTFSGCDFLDKVPEDVIVTDKFFSSADAAALEQYCNGLYPNLIQGHGDPQTYTYGMMERELQSDNMYPWDKNDISFGHQTAPTEAKDTEWKWENIRTCNNFLQNYKRSPVSETVKNRYAGEILFFKCMDYFNKVRTYGDVPWYEEVLSPGDPDLYKGRDPRTLVMDNVLRDINQAIRWLPVKTAVSKVSKDAALALKARMCLYEGTWRRYHGMEGDVKFLEAAYEAAGELMKPEYGYALFRGSAPSKAYYELFIQADYNNNSEVILSKEYEPAKGKGNNLTRQIYAGEAPIGMSKDCADDYLCATTGKPISMCGCEGHTRHTTFIAELNNRDPRLLQTIPTPEAGPYTYYLGGKRPAIGKVVAGNHGTSSTGYCIIKYYNPGEYSAAHHQGTLDAPVFRFAEILLVRAEAGAELGKDPQLDLTVNALRDRVGFSHHLSSSPEVDPKLVDEYPDVKGNNATLIREIRRERRVELFGEGYRYDDLMRWACGPNLAKHKAGMIPDPTLYTQEEMNKLNTELGTYGDGSLDIYGKRVQSPAVFTNPKHYLFAIPLNEISLNPNLEPNNPGW